MNVIISAAISADAIIISYIIIIMVSIINTKSHHLLIMLSLLGNLGIMTTLVVVKKTEDLQLCSIIYSLQILFLEVMATSLHLNRLSQNFNFFSLISIQNNLLYFLC